MMSVCVCTFLFHICTSVCLRTYTHMNTRVCREVWMYACVFKDVAKAKGRGGEATRGNEKHRAPGVSGCHEAVGTRGRSSGNSLQQISKNIFFSSNKRDPVTRHSRCEGGKEQAVAGRQGGRRTGKGR